MSTQKEIKEWCDENIPKDGLCPILKIKPDRWTVDHDHFDLRVRGVISQQANTLEGYIQKYFLKYCAKYTKLALPDILRAFADYLEQPYWLENKLHYKGVESLRKHLLRCKKETIIEKAKRMLNISLEDSLTKEELIDKYLEIFIEQMENNKW